MSNPSERCPSDAFEANEEKDIAPCAHGGERNFDKGRLKPAATYYFMCCRERSFSRQISSINSASTIKRSLIVTVNDFV